MPLVALCNADAKAKTTPLPPKFVNLPMIDSYKPGDLAQTLLAFLRAWRNLPNGAIIINALSGTCFPWADCPPNQVTGRLKAGARLAIQCL
jgi:hypothetical protein